MLPFMAKIEITVTFVVAGVVSISIVTDVENTKLVGGNNEDNYLHD